MKEKEELSRKKEMKELCESAASEKRRKGGHTRKGELTAGKTAPKRTPRIMLGAPTKKNMNRLATMEIVNTTQAAEALRVQHHFVQQGVRGWSSSQRVMG